MHVKCYTPYEKSSKLFVPSRTLIGIFMTIYEHRYWLFINGIIKSYKRLLCYIASSITFFTKVFAAAASIRSFASVFNLDARGMNNDGLKVNNTHGCTTCLERYY